MNPSSRSPIQLLNENRFRVLLLRGMAFPMLLCAFFALFLLWQEWELNGLRQDVFVKRNILVEAQQIETALLKMETGLRGYWLTHDRQFLQPYTKAAPGLRAQLSHLQNGSREDPEQWARSKKIAAQSLQWSGLVATYVTAPPADVQSAAKTRFDSIRQTLDAYIERQREVWDVQRGYLNTKQTLSSWVAALLLLSIGAVLAYSTSRLLRSLSNLYVAALEESAHQTSRAEDLSGLYRLITENSADLISIVDREGKYTFVSPSYERVLGFKQEELLGQRFRDFVHPQDEGFVAEADKELRDGGTARAVYRYRTKQGEYRYIETVDTRVRDMDVGVARDVTQRIENEHQIRDLNVDLEHRVSARTAELAMANRELEAFSYSVSHDLRAPLRSIASFSMILQEDLEGKLDAESADNLSRIRAAAQKMTDLIDALLRFSRIVRAELKITEMDLSEHAEVIVNELRRREPGRTVEVEIQPHLVDRGDAQLLRSVLANLLENAWKFTSKSEHPKISFGRTEGKEPHYFIRDNGVGFDQQFVDKVFVPFERLHTDREFPGTGIGLATVKRVIERHGGKIWATAELGQGAEFNFTLH